MTPEEKLCSRTWRLRNSAGLLWSILSFGFLAGVGFLIRGVKAKNKLWIAMGIGFLVVSIGLMATAGIANPGTKAAPITTPYSALWGWVMFANFVGGALAAFLTNRKWLIWKAHANEVAWYVQAGSSKPPAGTAPATGYAAHAAAAALRPAALSPVFGPAPAAHGTLDVNSASAQDLQTMLGVDAATANRIVDVRQSQGAFTSFEQLMAKGQVQPHILIPHRQALAFGDGTGGQLPPNQETAAQAQPKRSTGSQSARRLDI